jgi:hypothetical protein
MVVGGGERGRRQTNLCLKISGLDKRSNCSTTLWSKAYPQKRMGLQTQECNKLGGKIEEFHVVFTVHLDNQLQALETNIVHMLVSKTFNNRGMFSTTKC